jgi:uncharacterized alkaline shock family protein YloU
MGIREEEKTEFGAIKIHNNVLASVAYLATQEVDGVSRICQDLRSRLLNLLGKKTPSGAIDVRQDAHDDNVTIVIPLVIKYGYNIPEVAARVQERVKAAVEEATDLTPREIAIKIKGVEK